MQKKYCNKKTSKIAIFPIPFARSLSYGKGAEKGPFAIIDAAKQTEVYDIDTDTQIYKKGIFVVNPIQIKKTTNKIFDAKKMINKACKECSKLIQNKKFVIVLGGEHTISIGPVMAYKKYFDDLSILHLDAHSDRREKYENNPYSHACVISRIIENYPKIKIVSVGIRSADAKERKFIKSKNSNFFFAKDIYNKYNWYEKVVKKLSKNVYITFDVDVLDPCYMPTTGTPEPGGLDYYQVLNLIKKVINSKNLVGMDIVELSPIRNINHPQFLISKLIYQILSYKFKK